jgi:hypothetical protein
MSMQPTPEQVIAGLEAEVERLRTDRDLTFGTAQNLLARAERAEAEVETLRAGWVCAVPGCNCDVDYRAALDGDAE